jgi:flagellin
MTLVINTNTISLNAQRNLALNGAMVSKSLEKMASGYRINRAGDDAAGLAISENLRGQIRGSKKALDNVQDGINVLNVVDGAYQTISDYLQRIRELAVQAGNDTYRTAQRTAINQEINAIRTSINQIANSTRFNGVALIASAGVPANYRIQVGANNSATNDMLNIRTALGNTTTAGAGGLALGAANITSNATARTYINTVTNSINTLNTKRATLGAMQNRLEGVAKNLMVGIENNAAAESRVRNVDVASESAELIRVQILQQSASSILAQANQVPSLALKLLS